MLWFCFSSKIVWCTYIVSIAKTAPKKTGALISSMKFLSLEVAFYLYKSTIGPCMEYCCYDLAGTFSCYLHSCMIYRKAYVGLGPSLATSFELLAYHKNVACLSLFECYYFSRCSSELAELVPLPYSHENSAS